MNPQPSPITHSPRQLAARWSFHEESIRRIIRDGRLPAMRLGKRLRVADADVLAFEHHHRIANQEPKGGTR